MILTGLTCHMYIQYWSYWIVRTAFFGALVTTKIFSSSAQVIVCMLLCRLHIGEGSSISYFSLLQLNSLPSIAPSCNRYICTKVCSYYRTTKGREIAGQGEGGGLLCNGKRVSAGRSRTISLFFIFYARESSAYYYVVLTMESLHASQLLYPFYMSFLEQSALGQSRLPGTCLLHQDS